jgi:hypothetical protein
MLSVCGAVVLVSNAAAAAAVCRQAVGLAVTLFASSACTGLARADCIQW